MPTIDILGVPHAYELTPPPANSSTPVLIFIHGWLLSRNYWQPLIERLAARYQCLIYDLRGFGDSQPVSSSLSNGESSYNLAAYAEDLRILLAQLKIEQAWLIGHSLGGSIALWGADYCADTVKGVICLNFGGGIYLKEEFERFRAVGQQLVQRRPRWLTYVPLLDFLFARIMVARPLPLCWGKQRVLDLVKADREAALGSLLDSTTEAEVHLLPQIVSRLQQPVYFLAGEKDIVMELKYVRHLASFHQLFETEESNVIEIPDCGHLSMVEQPEVVVEQIIRILRQNRS
jgi:pimeloyl-ACP methyl ester carboxylesterase